MQALRFEGRGGEYFRIWIVNVLLTIITLSIYYPWAKVRTLRYFHGNTTLEGRSFDYHATGKQLLVGYLISLVLVLLFIGLQTVIPFFAPVAIVIGLLVAPWVIWKSLSFNMRMTSFSNVRFGFEGTGGGAYKSFLLWPVIFLLALVIGPAVAGFLTGGSVLEPGLAAIVIGVVIIVGYLMAFWIYARMKKSQTRYMINGYRYGQGEFSTDVKTGGFAMIMLKTIGLAILMAIVVIIIIVALSVATGIASSALDMKGALDDPEVLTSLFAQSGVIALITVAYFALLFAMFLIFAYAYTRQRSYILSNSLLDGSVRFDSTLGATRYAWVMLSNLILILFTLGLALPWTRVRLARVVAEHTEVDTSIGFDDYMSQKRSEQSSLGEQLGDAFDVDVGIGF